MSALFLPVLFEGKSPVDLAGMIGCLVLNWGCRDCCFVFNISIPYEMTKRKNTCPLFTSTLSREKHINDSCPCALHCIMVLKSIVTDPTSWLVLRHIWMVNNLPSVSFCLFASCALTVLYKGNLRKKDKRCIKKGKFFLQCMRRRSGRHISSIVIWIRDWRVWVQPRSLSYNHFLSFPSPR